MTFSTPENPRGLAHRGRHVEEAGGQAADAQEFHHALVPDDERVRWSSGHKDATNVCL